MMVIELGLFFVVLLGSKIVLGAVAVYMLVPLDEQCAICDAEMLPVEHPRGTDRVLRLCRLQRRWCMECNRDTLTRRRQLSARQTTGPALPVAQPRVR